MADRVDHTGSRQVRHLRQILLWPLQLIPLHDSDQIQRHWKYLGPVSRPWFEVADEFTEDPAEFQVRHYTEFATFLPAVRRFLYGELYADGYRRSPIRVFRRTDITQVRLSFKQDLAPVEMTIAHLDLYFFYDIDVVLLAVEAFADNLELDIVQEILFRFGRSYPPSWDDHGQGDHCLAKVEWLAAGGEVLAVSDYENRSRFLSQVCRERTAAISADWEYLLSPMVPQFSERTGELRYRQLEYSRMPMMVYLAVEDLNALTRGDFVRLALATRSGAAERLPFCENFLAGFEADYCYDRYWGGDHASTGDTRFLCSGHVFAMVGAAGHPFYTDAERGALAQFRHQYFLIGLIAHFHRATLLMFGDRLSSAVSRLNIRDAESVKRFKRVIRQLFEIFLRFTHRYWFHEVSVQAQAKAIFSFYRRHQGIDPLYDDIRNEIRDMVEYLDSDGLRRQANTVVRLTVVTTFGLIGTVTTGFLGMNLLAEADQPLWLRGLYFIGTLVPTIALTFYTLMISKRLSDVLEAFSDERLPLGTKLKLLARVWMAPPSVH